MKKVSLKKDDIKALCLAACRDWQVYAPLEGMGRDVQFVRINDKAKNSFLNNLNLDYEQLVIAPKVIGFPQLESLFEFQGENITETVQPTGKKLLFGLRACDVKAIRFADKFFKKDFEDVYYLSRSQNRLLVLVGCNRPPRDCFCTSTKTGPFLPAPNGDSESEESDFDLQMVDIGDTYVVEAGSQKGEEFISDYGEFFGEASDKMVAESKKAKSAAEQVVTHKVNFEKAVKNFCEDKFPKDTYEKIAQRCIYCGGCLYVCPTCTCFNVFDEKQRNSGRRYRNWDACVLEGYTREASGHNPRHEKWLRAARRYEHKLKYDYLTTGISGCVGCGRCLSSCPVNIGIIQVIEEAAKI